MKESMAFEQGEYKHFNGVIMWGNTEGYVKNARFSLMNKNGNKMIMWYEGIFKNGVLSDTIFINGIFENGNFKNSSFENGLFKNGNWIKSSWNKGKCIRCEGNRFDNKNFQTPYRFLYSN